MNNCSCSCRNNCVGIAVIVSAVIGIITAFLTISATIAVAPAFLWVLFGVAVVYLGLTLIAAPAIRSTGVRGCVCDIVPVLLTGILGTILAAIVLLGIAFAATSIVGAIITGLLLAFFSLVITSTACLVKCAAGCGE